MSDIVKSNNQTPQKKNSSALDRFKKFKKKKANK